MPALIGRRAVERGAGGLSAITDCIGIDWGERSYRGQTPSLSNSFKRRRAHLIFALSDTPPSSAIGPGRISFPDRAQTPQQTP
jgi:hypothetical protein